MDVIDVLPQVLAQPVGQGTVDGDEPPPTSVRVKDVVQSRAALQRLLAAAAALDAAAEFDSDNDYNDI